MQICDDCEGVTEFQTACDCGCECELCAFCIEAHENAAAAVATGDLFIDGEIGRQ